MLLSAIGTITLLIIAGWILSIQYPEESKSLWNGIRNTFLYIAGVTANNRTSAPLEEQDLQETEDTLDQHDHTIEPVASPLADAIDQAKQQPQDENKAQTLFQTIASGEDNTIDFNTQQDLTTQLQQSGDYSSQATGIASTYTTPLTLPNTVPRPSIKEFHELVLNL